MKQPLVALALSLHFVWFAIFVVFIWVGSYDEPSTLQRIMGSVGLPDSRDAIAHAAELGRLDVVSLSLTLLGAVLALAAFGSYFTFRHTVIQTTREEASRAITDPRTIQAIIKVMKSDPLLLDKLQTAVKDGTLTDEDADDIAEAME